jgi:hypothetical protein
MLELLLVIPTPGERFEIETGTGRVGGAVAAGDGMEGFGLPIVAAREGEGLEEDVEDRGGKLAVDGEGPEAEFRAPGGT